MAGREAGVPGEGKPGREIAAPPVADPAPLGWAAFALTLFLFSARNSAWTNSTAWLPYALAYGGVALVLAGMWEFRHQDTFLATAFTSYGAFWFGIGLYALTLAPSVGTVQVGNDVGWILIGFLIFNTYMLLWSMQVNEAVFGVFLTLEATWILLCLGSFLSSPTTIRVAGYVGVLTALVAWYASAADLINAMAGRSVLKVGTPMMGRMQRMTGGILPHH